MAKTNLVPIKVILKRRPNGEADWPNFNLIDSAIRNGKPWSKYIDSEGISWHYDKVENLGTGATNGVAATMVPKNFADAAVALFPDIVTIVNEVTFETFYNERVAINAPTEFLDTDELAGIAARVQLEIDGIAPAPSAEIVTARAKCLDPNEQTYRGIRKNMKKKWSDTKAELQITVDPDLAKAV